MRTLIAAGKIGPKFDNLPILEMSAEDREYLAAGVGSELTEEFADYLRFEKFFPEYPIGDAWAAFLRYYEDEA